MIRLLCVACDVSTCQHIERWVDEKTKVVLTVYTNARFYLIIEQSQWCNRRSQANRQKPIKKGNVGGAMDSCHPDKCHPDKCHPHNCHPGTCHSSHNAFHSFIATIHVISTPWTLLRWVFSYVLIETLSYRLLHLIHSTHRWRNREGRMDLGLHFLKRMLQRFVSSLSVLFVIWQWIWQDFVIVWQNTPRTVCHLRLAYPIGVVEQCCQLL